ncbi:MAG TPA: phosphate ABC transporter permease subunit PstC [Ktedonobacterales bacterium]
MGEGRFAWRGPRERVPGVVVKGTVARDRRSDPLMARLGQTAVTACAWLVIVVMATIFLFVCANAYQTFTVDHISPAAFFLNPVWSPDDGKVGALVLLTGSVTVTLLAVLLSTPISVGLAIFITQMAPHWARQLMQPVIELLTGIPSIIYGFLGLTLIVPLVANVYNSISGGRFSTGFGIIAAALVLAIMILPTITTITIDTLAALPGGLREASLALGATRWQTVRKTLLPAASSGIATGIVLGMGRAIGETLAVSYVIGSNANSFPLKISNVYPYVTFPPTSTITVQLLFDFGEASNPSLNYHAIWTLAFVLLVISCLLVAVSRWIAARGVYQAPKEKLEGGGLGRARRAVLATIARRTGA